MIHECYIFSLCIHHLTLSNPHILASRSDWFVLLAPSPQSISNICQGGNEGKERGILKSDLI